MASETVIRLALIHIASHYIVLTLVLVRNSNRIILGLGIKSSNDSQTFMVVPMGKQPTWGLGKNNNTADKDKSEKDLQSNGKSPRDGTLKSWR